MLKLFYGLSIRIYAGVASIAAWFSPKARLWVSGRKKWRQNLKLKLDPVKEAGQRVAWFHAASLGEFEQGRSVIEAFRLEYPDYYIVLTFFSPSGYEIRKGYKGADYICYLPADTATNARDFIAIVNPAIAFFVKYEFWYNYLRILAEKRIPTILFSAIFRQDQIFFKNWAGFYRSWLTFFTVIMVQDKASANLLNQVEGVGEIVVAGDTRFDRVKQLVNDRRDFPEISAFVGDVPCLVAGSVWSQDMDLLILALNSLGVQMKAIIAPHEIRPEDLTDWEHRLDLPSLRYSEYRESGFQLPEISPQYLFIDNVGMLSSLYAYGQIAYIGGAFGKGLHNTLEAATYGMPIFFGNLNYRKFSEAVALQENGIAVVIGACEMLVETVEKLLIHPDDLARIASDSRYYVERNTGATQRVIEAVKKVLV